MKRVFGLFEAFFDAFYLTVGVILAAIMLLSGTGGMARTVAGIAALVLVFGDAFHLIPRIAVIQTKDEERFRTALGIGKQITSVSMTVFYLILWLIALLIYTPENNMIRSFLVCLFAAARIVLCLCPQNRWTEKNPPFAWNIYRNIPFFLLGAVVAGIFYEHREVVASLRYIWVAIAASFAFYLPVVLHSGKHPRVGMFMLPKTLCYLWILLMFSGI